MKPKPIRKELTTPWRCSRMAVAKARTSRLVQNGTSTRKISQRLSRAEPCAIRCATGKASSTVTGVTMALMISVFIITRR